MSLTIAGKYLVGCCAMSGLEKTQGKTCTMIGIHDRSCKSILIFLETTKNNKNLPQAIHYDNVV